MSEQEFTAEQERDPELPEFSKAVRKSLEDGSFQPIPHPDLWPKDWSPTDRVNRGEEKE